MKKYKIVTLLGSSTKFKKYFKTIERDLTFEGYIVISLGFFNEEINFIPTNSEKELLTDMMKQKIEMSDLIYVINPNGYIGETTKCEIEYAKSLDKPIKYYFDSKREEGVLRWLYN